MKRMLRRLARVLGLGGKPAPSSTGYEIISLEEARAETGDGWLDKSVAERQDAAFSKLLHSMYEGSPRRDLVVAAEAVRATGLEAPVLLEVGCGSGYYSEVLPHLLGRPVNYTGLDYSEAMIEIARARYPGRAFVVGDATALPFPDASIPIVLNGVSLMHILAYGQAIAESGRVSAGWCIYHTVPVLERRATTFLRKNAYGRPTIEVIFNETELRDRFDAAGFDVARVVESLPYDLSALLGEPTLTKTYICRRRVLAREPRIIGY